MDLQKVINSPFMFIITAIPVFYVLVQAFLFYKAARKRGKEIGMDDKGMNKIVRGTAIFSIMPAVPILLFLIILAPGLGLFFPWLRLSVIGSGVYENLIAQTIGTGMGYPGLQGLSSEAYLIIMVTMTLAIMAGPILTVVALKPIISKIDQIESQEGGFGPELVPSVFIGLLVAIALPSLLPKNVVVDEVTKLQIPWVAIVTFISSALMVIGLGKLSEKTQNSTIKEFSFPVSILLGMVVAIIFSAIM